MAWWYIRIGDPPPRKPGSATWTLLAIVVAILALGGCADALGLIR